MMTPRFRPSTGLRALAAVALAVACTRPTPGPRATVPAAAPAVASAPTDRRTESPRGPVAAAASARAETIRPVHVVDSIFPPAEQLRRFRAGLPRSSGLAGASPSRDALAKRFLAAVQRGDTADLRAMAISRAEFAYIYYPTSTFSRPPHREDPRIVWFLIRQNSESGVERALRRLTGHRLVLRALRCPPPIRSDEVVAWEGCTVSFTRDDTPVQTLRLFGSIVGKDGRYKLLSYANDY